MAKNEKKDSKNVSMPSDLKYLNRKRILQIIRNEDFISVNDISEATKISRPTIKKAIQSFEDKGLVISVGKGASTNAGGKRPGLYSFYCEKVILCIYLENERIYFTILSMKNECIREREVPFRYGDTFEKFQDILISNMYLILKESEICYENLYGISLAIGGFVERNIGIVRFYSKAPEWGRNLPIKAWLKELFPKQVIVVENLVRTAGRSLLLEEKYRNKRMAAIYTGAGISACYIDREVLTGRNALIGEIGHMTIDYSDEEVCSCGSRGCFEQMVSESRILNKLNENTNKLSCSTMKQWVESEDIIRHLFEEADKGDELAKDVVSYLAEMFSLMLKNIAINFDPEIIVMQGKYAYAGEYFKTELKEARKKAKFFPEETASKLYYDMRPLRELQKLGGYQELSKRFFDNPELYEEM
ncbi:ROK family transcriptional regulator [Terrisporobacter mayombei]|uniref:N-acetylglucosamine repressor n=1 Tax=Terrisporobacter mayombei TaxID=1541 RepID=A0ABY9PXL6_9FIRM|nr:ROK family transcriptional regulator [Terrisporobacter mayombei]MCC3867980.1 ROK family transcriptional regulator [Terrisporobacter mayombei]WMT80114.1 N-acetylglucosamine repressor [Terrisporobacter mayombei]